MSVTNRYLHRLVIVFGTALLLAAPAAKGLGQGISVAGEYGCVLMGNGPCYTHIPMRLQSNGYWGWAKYSGQYQVANGAVEFISGSGGPVAWGPAVLGPGTLTFTSGGKAVVWRKQ